MLRKLRIEYAGTFYHVITRGNQKQRIFKDTPDYAKYLQIATSYQQRHHFHIYAYVLMQMSKRNLCVLMSRCNIT